MLIEAAFTDSPPVLLITDIPVCLERTQISIDAPHERCHVSQLNACDCRNEGFEVGELIESLDVRPVNQALAHGTTLMAKTQ